MELPLLTCFLTGDVTLWRVRTSFELNVIAIAFTPIKEYVSRQALAREGHAAGRKDPVSNPE